MKLPTITLLLLTISLSACIKAPTLEERLVGKTGGEREKELYYACIQRANNKIPSGHDSAYIDHESRMWELCDVMHETNTQEEKHAPR
jgi:hypothetical protein